MLKYLLPKQEYFGMVPLKPKQLLKKAANTFVFFLDCSEWKLHLMDQVIGLNKMTILIPWQCTLYVQPDRNGNLNLQTLPIM